MQDKNKPVHNHNIAIICRSAFGDLIYADTLMQYCKDLYPNASITLFADDKNKALLPFLSHFNRSVILPSRGNRLLKLFPYALKYRNQFDIAICSKGSPSRTLNLFLFLLNAKKRIAYIGNNWHGKLVNHGVLFDPTIPGTCHHVEELMALISPTPHTTAIRFKPKLNIPNTISNRYLARIQQILIPIRTNDPLLFISVSNNRDYSFLGVDGYKQVLENAYKQVPFSVIVSCLPQDTAIANELVTTLSVPALAVPTANFAEFMVLLNEMDACFIGEGGIMHMAASLNIPQLALFARTSITSWAPLNENATIVSDHKDVKLIPKDTITAALTNMLQDINSHHIK